MRIAHIILTHKNHAQLARLIERLRHPQSDFYIHVDAKVPSDDLKELQGLPNVIFIKNRIECNWGGFTILKAIFNSITEVFASGIKYDFINLLSGQDYPITSPQHIYDFLNQHMGKNFISYDASHNSEWWKTATDRYEKYHFTDLSFKGKFFAEKVLNMVMPARKFPEYTEMYGGNKSTWWTISAECAAYLNEKFNNSPQLIEFLKYCWGTDEFVIPTLIMNSPFKDQVVNDNLRYIDWSEGNANPKVFDLSEFENIRNSKMLFARKFDLSHDQNILNKIDQELLTSNN
ncbi:beta-1,6-N-acetylglucosaminyltransferase [Pedobacter hartonius]|uniref:Peptide O-xylosyltransferase n=1 Tax=Pedobacter hartonius TaxID=425514 RepID=A0A1H4GHP9_9SPHI|nr:beta-1,6-N-acetylglucosaminyltransferase [Pedobacter hartonius]SEB09126.1 Core-2/I-Branching enzyme [Pedobacter hartonius]